MMRTMTTTSLANWFGADRMIAASIAAELSGYPFVAVPFGGGMSILAHLKARSIVVADAHSHVINLANVVKHPVLGPKLYRELRRLPFHPKILAEAQERCRQREELDADSLFAAGNPDPRFEGPDLQWAQDFFICSWLAHGGKGGTDGEFDASFSVRYDAGGGDSNRRFRSATHSLLAWRKHVLWRCNFVCQDCFEFLENIKDAKEKAIYSDSPWVGPGDGYRHKFMLEDHRRLARKLGSYKQTRVVVRYGVCPLIEELYPRDVWDWKEQTSRSQSNGDVKEALIINRRAA